MDFSVLFSSEGLLSLIMLTFMEIVLGVDNIIFISILSNTLPPVQEKQARLVGISLALIVRVALLSAVVWIVAWSKPIFEIYGFDVSIRDIILFLGGAFLLYKSTLEIHEKLEGHEEVVKKGKGHSLTNVIVQIVLIDIVFSFDSILTAVGLANHLLIMIIAVVISMVLMLVFSGTISAFINKHPTIKMLALSFLLLIGVLLVMEAFHQHVPKGYIYFAIAFSLFVEILNNRAKKVKESRKEVSDKDETKGEQ